MTKKKLVILSDSLGRPRPNIDAHDKTEYEDTYGYILREKLGPNWIVDICYVESLDSQDALMWCERMVAYRRPDVAILHFGINDCAPRVFKKDSRPIIYNSIFKALTFNIFAKVVFRFRYQLTRLRKLVYTKPQDFISNLKSMKKTILEFAPDAKVFIVNIAKTTQFNNARSFGFNVNIDQYNTALEKEFNIQLININSDTPEKVLIKDGIHLTKPAHQKLADLLETAIKRG